MTPVELQSLAWGALYAVVYIAAIFCALRSAFNDRPKEDIDGRN